MIGSMPQHESQTVHTRVSLLRGIQAGDEDRWHEFHRLYPPIIRAFALKAGLTETEADEVVQETCIGLAKNVGEFHYDPAKCRFKTWLLNLANSDIFPIVFAFLKNPWRATIQRDDRLVPPCVFLGKVIPSGYADRFEGDHSEVAKSGFAALSDRHQPQCLYKVSGCGET